MYVRVIKRIRAKRANLFRHNCNIRRNQTSAECNEELVLFPITGVIKYTT